MEYLLYGISLPHRLANNVQKDLVFKQFFIQLLSSIAVTVATATYLWGYETENKCEAPFDGADWNRRSEYIDVAKRFRDILKIWFVFGLIDCLRCGLVFAYILYDKAIYAIGYHVLTLNDILGLAAVLILHVYRFQFTGKWCSGDFLPESKATEGFLVERGKFLVGLVIYVWVGGFVMACVYSCVMVAAYRRYADKQNASQIQYKV
ncbi:UNKNOWN [Stylonychia lemnae]|uniref:Uncharacterized protein n=1 Tax=Stylonychia lemnae TaxID=5949 RepID=A0A077ZWM5_STYLE|nr:UNKNOWN [Stylonychia lemnae]|eukprot:CDW73991.1 UNKNOWN [Stylonychia lemnae]